jgi:hypothetical protein
MLFRISEVILVVRHASLDDVQGLGLVVNLGDLDTMPGIPGTLLIAEEIVLKPFQEARRAIGNILEMAKKCLFRPAQALRAKDVLETKG